MQSTYIVKYPFKGYEVKINVRRENIEVVSEPAANMIFTKFKYKDKKFENLVLIDGGGSSIDGVVARENKYSPQSPIMQQLEERI